MLRHSQILAVVERLNYKKRVLNSVGYYPIDDSSRYFYWIERAYKLKNTFLFV